jgi:hypothetical protein
MSRIRRLIRRTERNDLINFQLLILLIQSSYTFVLLILFSDSERPHSVKTTYYKSLGDMRKSCERINNKAPTLETGWGFVLLLIVTYKKKSPAA